MSASRRARSGGGLPSYLANSTPRSRELPWAGARCSTPPLKSPQHAGVSDKLLHKGGEPASTLFLLREPSPTGNKCLLRLRYGYSRPGLFSPFEPRRCGDLTHQSFHPNPAPFIRTPFSAATSHQASRPGRVRWCPVVFQPCSREIFHVYRIGIIVIDRTRLRCRCTSHGSHTAFEHEQHFVQSRRAACCGTHPSCLPRAWPCGVT
ncbi:hypothetical protein B0H67DRAFT_279866 [Lasiosphaeris hirsuta]|uniref:Uncharacterized protein n=1 Tax=Lasiosphaeris hirsuta TaxID=260670 RepID=A0AA40DRY4_9PEZI|nr:hypothetical protein B0H67DRAFT_279866 [Lasiosphaeris hirsuta]